MDGKLPFKVRQRHRFKIIFALLFSKTVGSSLNECHKLKSFSPTKEVEADRLAIESCRPSPARRDRRAGGTHDNELLSSSRKRRFSVSIVSVCVCALEMVNEAVLARGQTSQ
jgi:hypothetical protein